MTRHPHTPPFVALLLLASAAGAGAQEPAAAYWEDLERAASAADVRAVPVPGALDAELARGMRQGRLYEFTGTRRDAYRGRAVLTWLAERRPRDPWVHFALGALLARGPDAMQRAAGGAFVDEESLAFTGAVRALRRALELDPGLAPAAEELLRLGLAARDRALVAEGAAALQGMRSGRALLLLAGGARLQGEPERSAELARTAESAGADAAAALHARAAALLQLPGREQEAAEAYLAGTRRLSPESAAVYWRAVAPILDAEEAAAWDRTPLGERGAWLRRFWELRAARAGVTLPERLAVHFRRIQEADTLFPLRAGLRADRNDLRLETGIDPRELGMSLEGLMLVRHGDPRRVSRGLAACAWGTPYFLEREPPGDAADHVVPTDEMALRMEALGLPPNLRVSCRPVDPAFARLHKDRMRRLLVRQDSYVPAVAQRLAFAAGLYSFRGRAGTVDLLAALAVPGGALGALAEGAPSLTADVALVLIDEAQARVERSDVRVHLGVPEAVRMPGGNAVLGLLQTSLATSFAGPVSFRLMLRDTSGAHAGGWLAGDVVVPALHGGGLHLSDLVLAPADAQGTWRRGAVALSPAPGKAFEAGEPVQLFYEVYGLAADEPYRTEILLAPREAGLWAGVRRLFAGAPNVVHVRFGDSARGPHAQYGVQELRTLGTAALAPGSYRVEVRVTSGRTGGTAVATRLLEIAPAR